MIATILDVIAIGAKYGPVIFEAGGDILGFWKRMTGAVDPETGAVDQAAYAALKAFCDEQVAIAQKNADDAARPS